MRCRRGGLGGQAVAVQVVLPHEVDELRAVAGVRRVDAGEGIREGVGRLAEGHGLAVVAAVGQQLAMVIDALGDIVIGAEG
jgi:hypothetical protein